MAILTFIPNSASAKKGTGLTLDEIPQEVKDDVEQVYEALKTNPGRMRVTFDNLTELNTYMLQATAYCALRPAGEIRFRKSPSRGLPATTMDFRITDMLLPKEAVTEDIRTATENVKTAAKK